MQFSFIRDLVNSVWMVDALTLEIYAPVLRGIFNGLQFEREQSDDKYKPYNIAVKENSSNPQSDKSIFVQPVRGMMMKHDTMSGLAGARTMAQNLLNADNNQNIIGHILVIESGGGQADAVPELADAIGKLTKPIVAWVDGYMCSAAMYVGSYCKKIIASRETDMVGCIGTMIQLGGFPKFNKDADGFTSVRIYADGSDEKNDDYETALTGDFKLIKERILNPHNERFKTNMQANRPGVKDEHLKGRTFPAGEVVGILVDEIGNFDTAVQAVMSLSKKTSKVNNMSNKKLTNLTTTLGITELVVNEGHASLNEQQLESVENALATGAQSAADLATANANLQTANATIAERDATITAQAARIAELEKSPGASQATVVVDTDSNLSGDSEATPYETARKILKG